MPYGLKALSISPSLFKSFPEGKPLLVLFFLDSAELNSIFLRFWLILIVDLGNLGGRLDSLSAMSSSLASIVQG
jgi:hypothetical protein